MNLENFIGVIGMSTLTATVVSVKKDTVKSGRNAGKTFYKVGLPGDQILYAWSFKAIEGIKKGEKAKFTVEKRPGSNYISILSAEPTDEDIEDEEMTNEDEEISPFDDDEDDDEIEEEKSKPMAYEHKSSYTPRSDNNPFITRMSALKSAIDYANYTAEFATDKQKALKESDILEIAKIFASFITSGEAEE